MKFLLRPSWIAAIVVIVVFSALSFSVLAPWQFHRHVAKQTRNDAVRTSQHSEPRPLSELLPRGAAPSARTEWQKVQMRGRYLPEGEAVARLRTVLGEPAFEVLTPFRTSDGQHLLINRGYVRPVRGTSIPNYPAPPPGEVTVTARIQADESDSQQRQPFQADGHRQVYSINSRTVSDATHIDLRPGYFQLVENQPGVLTPIPLPQLDSGPHFSYALQWIAFGIMAPLGIGYLIYREFRPAKDKLKVSVAAAVAEEEQSQQSPRPHQRSSQSPATTPRSE